MSCDIVDGFLCWDRLLRGWCDCQSQFAKVTPGPMGALDAEGSTA